MNKRRIPLDDPEKAARKAKTGYTDIGDAGLYEMCVNLTKVLQKDFPQLELQETDAGPYVYWSERLWTKFAVDRWDRVHTFLCGIRFALETKTH